ncbi:MAG: polysaccharide deacetylase family protein [Hyphomicrobiaceae bacterium]
MQAKTAIFSLVYGLHKRFATKPLPERLGVYFHSLEKHEWPAFRDCVATLRFHGYEIVSIDDFIRPEKPHRKQAFISFDDNYKSWHEALGLFRELDVKLTFYVNTLPLIETTSRQEISTYFDRIVHHGDRTAMSGQDVKELHAEGHTIAAHTHSHFALNKLPPDKWDEEILQSKLILEDLIGESVRHFSYPFGMRRFFNSDLEAYCQVIGFETIAAAIPGMQYAQPFNKLQMHRTAWTTDATANHMVEKLCIDGRVFEKLTGRSAIG